ncbi:efflux RND transporter permease subunit [Caulobacter vibrioides]|uniref:efflux RND transporter permease subunit n=1 Tax=Caulobacter vibrioides TaxID=155892 RepID=UPI000BB52A76|nr:efflux RND transporter permease subunit [Caulobacter vibrioides]ATC26080.1 AcrB/AcrD/AcrF family protein [Caulobacter vibrioides]AZH14220.1 efflux RND transporter permease subunit [Caulobacter vibrioides]PLR16797.1 AcrB/AcrD/AcrF family protein [Caulobacter vibrioides]
MSEQNNTAEHSTGQLRVSAWAIRNPIPVAVVFIALMIAGVGAYLGLPIKQFPNVEFPAVTVTVTQSGAAPGEMETQVTRPIEDAVASISNVKTIRSSVVQGASTTTIEFNLGEDLQKVTDEVRSKVDQARAVLPREVDEPLVQRLEITSAPIITYAVSAPSMSATDLSWFIDDTVTRALQGEKGVAQVARVGGVDREINVIIDPDRMASFGVTAPQLNQALASFSVDAPGGRASIGGREQTLRVLGAATTIEQLRQITIPVAGGRYVKLTDVAQVGQGSEEERGFARLDGKPVVAFQVMKTRDSSDVAVEDRVKVAIDKLAEKTPGVTFVKIFSTVDETRASFKATEHTLLEGMLLASLVVFLFLREWRATLITALAMPVSLVPTFAFMAFMGFSLNVVTLLALTLVIGILVDDAVVEIENIEKRVARGQRPFQAAMEGADAIGLAVVATTFTIVAVFVPVSFMPGMPGQFFKEFGLTVAVAVLFSLVVARLLTPLLAAYFLKPAKAPHPRKPFEGFYRNILDWSLDHRILACIIGGLIFVGSIMLAGLLPTAFQPPANNNYYYLKVQGPPGATVADMDRTVQQVTTLMRKRPEVTNVFAQVGSNIGSGWGGQSSADIRDATITIVLRGDRELSVTEIKQEVRASLRDIPDARVNLQGDWGSSEVQTILVSEDGPLLERTAAKIEREMQGLSTVADPRPSSPPSGPEILIRPKADEAARLGVSSADIAAIARVATVGDIDANVAKMTQGERRIPIRVRLPAESRQDLEALGALRVPTANGGSTRLDTVAELSFQAGPAKIDRFGRKRQVTVEADLNNGAQLGEAMADVDSLPTMKNLPAGVAPASAGDQEAFVELFTGFAVALLSAVGLVFGVLVLLFRSFFKPITILSALPLAIGGAFFGLLVMGQSLSMPSLIGFLMLMGLAAKNSILLVEYAIEQERAGMSQREAILDACHERARPIVMTTLAMMAGMLPTALGIGTGAEFRQPMAVAVIGGLITSTVLSLVLVPVVYEIVDDFEMWLKPKLARIITPREAPKGASII